MSKKQFLELLIKSFGLTPKDVSFYNTHSNGGEYGVGIGWKGKGVNTKGDVVISFHEPDGFSMAIHEILYQSYRKQLEPKYNSKH
jgi:hypothetical protein